MDAQLVWTIVGSLAGVAALFFVGKTVMKKSNNKITQTIKNGNNNQQAGGDIN